MLGEGTVPIGIMAERIKHHPVIVLSAGLLIAPVTWTHYLSLLLIPLAFLITGRFDVRLSAARSQRLLLRPCSILARAVAEPARHLPVLPATDLDLALRGRHGDAAGHVGICPPADAHHCATAMAAIVRRRTPLAGLRQGIIRRALPLPTKASPPSDRLQRSI